MDKKYNPTKIEKKWQEIWDKTKIYTTDLNSPKEKYYNLVMFPYPSGEFLHIGHAYSFSGADVYGRYKRLKGFNVFEPIGYDSFGLPAENFAIKNKVHPKESTVSNIKHAEKQLKAWGCMFDWSKTITTSEPNYYKWTQWLFLKLYQAGLAYQKEAPINWCPKCLTVLANEQVINGKCERCDREVVQKNMKQWFFKITDYAEKLINDLDKVNWPESSKIKQRNWIGKKDWIDIRYPVEDTKTEIIVSTTRPDTNFGATFVVVAPEHPFVESIIKGEIKAEKDAVAKIKKYAEEAQKKSELERLAEGRKKTGIFTGFYTVNQLNGYKMPLWVTDFVMMSVGTGAVVGVPGHDMRDFEFAQQFKLPIIRVVVGKDGDKSEITKEEQVQEKEGTMINSDFLDGLNIHDATKKITDYLEGKGWGKRVTRYHLRDWSFSRQRYWGAPIPIIYCEKCGVVPVPEKDLPVLLPDLPLEKVQPKGTGKGPLAGSKEFTETICPKCGERADRETDTMDTFVDSSFYFLRYPSVSNDKEMMDPEVTKKWLPPDMYVGGAEHVTMHLLYARFIAKVLFDAGLINFDEPFPRLRHQGMILGPNGSKMSKSRGNVIIPDEIIKKQGSDIFRMHLLFMGPFDEGGAWNNFGIKGMEKFLDRFWNFASNVLESKRKIISPEEIITKSFEIEETVLLKIAYQAAKNVTQDLEEFKFNTAISELMKGLNELLKLEKKLPISNTPETWQTVLSLFLRILSPFAPHFAEEIWSYLNEGDSIFNQTWPEWDESFLREEIITIAIQVNGKLRGEIEISPEMTKNEIEKMVLSQEKVKQILGGKKPKKIIYVPNKIISLVI